MFLTCPKLELKDSCSNEVCHCQSKVFSPICSADGSTVFTSPCNAGYKIENGSYFKDCSCLSISTDNNTEPFWLLKDGSSFNDYDAKKGYCPVECNTMFSTLLGLIIVVSFLGASQRTPNSLLTLRSINPADKSSGIYLISFVSI